MLKPTPWTRNDRLVAFGLYCRTPFGKMHRANPEIMRIADMQGRTASSLAMKLSNFASLDPAIISSGRSGLKGASNADRDIWQEFHQDWEALAVESSQALVELEKMNRAVPTATRYEPGNLFPTYEGLTKQATVEVRIKQSFFRSAVLSSYEGMCCISDVAESRLLIASHIVPWSVDKLNRLNPRNGLCLSALHDRAFDQGLITITPDFRVLVSKRLHSHAKNMLVGMALVKAENQRIRLPKKFTPDIGFLEWHKRHLFDANQ